MTAKKVNVYYKILVNFVFLLLLSIYILVGQNYSFGAYDAVIMVIFFSITAGFAKIVTIEKKQFLVTIK